MIGNRQCFVYFLPGLASLSALGPLLPDLDGWMGKDFKVREDGVRPVPDFHHRESADARTAGRFRNRSFPDAVSVLAHALHAVSQHFHHAFEIFCVAIDLIAPDTKIPV